MTRRPRVFETVREQISRDVRPVATLAPPWRRALVLLPWLVVSLAIVFAMLRPDHRELPALLLWGASVFFWAIAYGLLVACMREAVPGAAISWRYLVLGIAAALLVRLLIAAALHERSPYPAPEGDVWRTIMACSSAISLLGAPLLAVGCSLAVRGYLVRPAFAGVLIAFAAMIAAESVWRLHCPYTHPKHLVLTHWLPFVVLAPASGYLLARLFARRRAPAERHSAPTGTD